MSAQARTVNNFRGQGYAETAKCSRYDSSGANEPSLKRLQLLNVGAFCVVGEYVVMQLTSVVVSAHPGINAAVAARLVGAVRKTRSIVLLRCGERMANAGNILSVLALCAAMGTTVEVQACGEDEALAAKTVERILSEPVG
jgi:phosphotransferase system HPr (HPr) family protein